MPTYLSPDNDITIHDDGNISFGPAPLEAWSALFGVLQLSDFCAMAWTVVGDKIYLAVNAYATDEFEWRYRENGLAKLVMISDTSVYFAHGVSGTADAVITWVTGFTSNQSSLIVGRYMAGNSDLSIPIGSSAKSAGVGGVYKQSNLLSAGNVGTGEDVLYTETLDASMLALVKETMIFEFWGTIANNANAKTIRFRFGAAGVNLAFSRAMTVSVARSWYLKVEVIRTGSASQRAFCTMLEGSVADVQIVTTLDQTLSSAVVVTLTAEAVSNNDVVLLQSKSSWYPTGYL